MTSQRARKKAIRSLMAEKDITYTAAAELLDATTTAPAAISTRDDEDWITELMEGNGWSREEAITFADDPGNETLCNRCGWTVSMVCPECAEGCGCAVGCSGWRHAEWGGDDDDENSGNYCAECGGDFMYRCDCPDYEDDDQPADSDEYDYA